MTTAGASAGPRPRKLVVAGLVIGDDRRILITQRRADQELGLWWEFPGGKVEPGEAPVAALVRELREEIGVTVSVGRIWDVLFHVYPAFDLVMLVYVCRVVDGTPEAVEVADLAWVAAGDLPGWAILPADQPLVERLRTESLPTDSATGANATGCREAAAGCQATEDEPSGARN